MNERDLSIDPAMKEEERQNKLKILQEELMKHHQFFDDHGPVILGVRDKSPGFYEPKPKFPEEDS